MLELAQISKQIRKDIFKNMINYFLVFFNYPIKYLFPCKKREKHVYKGIFKFHYN